MCKLRFPYLGKKKRASSRTGIRNSCLRFLKSRVITTEGNLFSNRPTFPHLPANELLCCCAKTFCSKATFLFTYPFPKEDIILQCIVSYRYGAIFSTIRAKGKKSAGEKKRGEIDVSGGGKGGGGASRLLFARTRTNKTPEGKNIFIA